MNQTINNNPTEASAQSNAFPKRTQIRLLIIEVYEEISRLIQKYLSDNSKQEAYIAAFCVKTPEEAISIQESTKCDFVMMSLRTVKHPAALIVNLSNLNRKPKEYILYFGDSKKARGELAGVKMHCWNGNPTSADDLKDLYDLLTNLVQAHHLDN